MRIRPVTCDQLRVDIASVVTGCWWRKCDTVTTVGAQVLLSRSSDNMEDADIDNSDDDILTLYVRHGSMSLFKSIKIAALDHKLVF